MSNPEIRSGDSPNRVREFRTVQGLSQGELARRAGVTRQTVSAIEHQRYSPNVNVALKLARALERRTEDLFPLPEQFSERHVEIVGVRESNTRRVSLAQVRGRLIAYPLSPDRAIQEGFTGADAVLPRSAKATHAKLLASPEQLMNTALLVGCDPGVGILSAHVARSKAKARLAWLFASSRAALDAIGKGQAHVAGSHLQGRGEDDNVDDARRALKNSGGIVVAFAGWEQGLVVPVGNPKNLRSIEDLARPDVQLINREPGSGCRELLDVKLSDLGIAPDNVRGYERIATSHISVARSVASGGADAGVALRAAALACGLDFVPISSVRFDLIVPQDMLEHPGVATMLEVMQTRALREELETLPGYDVSKLGKVVAEFPASA